MNKIFLSILLNPQKALTLILYKIGFFKKPRFFQKKTKYDFSLTIVIPELISSIIYLTGGFEKDVELLLTNYLKKGKIYADIGAHIGYFSLIASKIVGEKGKVYAFEPTPSIYKILKKNTEQKKNIVTINAAVSSKIKQSYLKDFGIVYSAFNTICSSRLPFKKKFHLSKVKTITLDSFFTTRSSMPDFVKVDAENSELEILKGMRKILSFKHPLLCLEISDKLKRVSNGINSYLSEFGYCGYVINKKDIFTKLTDLSEQNKHYNNVLYTHKKYDLFKK